MKKLYIIIIMLMIFSTSNAQKKISKKKDYVITLETTKGNISLILYDGTPKHKANFVKICKKGIYNGVLFHRVIKDFMIQAGDPTSKDAKKGDQIGMNSHGEMIPAEIKPQYFHKKGVLAAARNNNPEKKSSGSQFYIVQGKKVEDDNVFESLEKRNKITFTEVQKKAYKEVGGTPHLDGLYTAYGEVVKGMDIVEKIAEVAVNQVARPDEDIKIIKTKVEVLKRKKITKLYGYTQPTIQ